MIVRSADSFGTFIRADPHPTATVIGVVRAADRLDVGEGEPVGRAGWVRVVRGLVAGWVNGTHLEVVPGASASRLGFHVIRQLPGQVDRIAHAGTHVVKVIDDVGMLQALHQRAPATTLIGRTMAVGDDFRSFLGSGDPVARASDWVRAVRPTMQAAPFAYWEAFNEPPTDAATMEAYGDFEAERQRLMALEGLAACVGQFSVGTPGDATWPLFYPALKAAHRYRNILGLHEYGALWVDAWYGPNQQPTLEAGGRVPLPGATADGWLFGRYRAVWRDHLLRNGWVNARVALTEFGLMSFAPEPIRRIAGYDVGSWRTCAQAWARLDNRPDTAAYYLEQLAWADDQMRRDPYVLGACTFTWGSWPGGDWQDDEVDGPVADGMLARMAAG